MPLSKEIKKVLVIGSGPIVIGQAAEFDYAGTQACRALREDGIEIVLINSNPATIMTDHVMADRIYIEPLTLQTVRRVIQKERPDSILSGLGGQTGLTLSMELAKCGFLEEMGVRLLGASPETIDRAEDRQMFKDTMEEIGQPTIASQVVTDVESALQFAGEIGYPVIVRPAFTLGGSGGGIAGSEGELRALAKNGLMLSPITQILVEKCISGWKEIEFEVMRDSAGNVITVCSMENLDPVGVHTGDSIVIAPAVTLSDKEYQMLRSAALNIVSALGVEGGCNCQFALHPESFDYAVIEVNPRVSRSSALASKATGYPIAKIATKIAIGYTLDEILNTVTGKTTCAFEPTLDYVAVKFPKWPFDKFVYARRDLGTQMKATGEVMTIAPSFEMALMKAVRGAEIGLDTLNMPKLKEETDGQIRVRLESATDERLFAVYEALCRGVSPEEIHGITMIDRWFLHKLLHLVEYERRIAAGGLDRAAYIQGKQLGYTDRALRALTGEALPERVAPTYKMVDTCAAEFEARTPYFYCTYDTPESGGENEALPFVRRAEKGTVVVLGSGPIRIGQGIEFDYASVHCVNSLKKLGYEVVLINNNPETVSTDFDTSDRLYFEPLTPEDVMNIIELERPVGVVVAFGGQTAIRLTEHIHRAGVPIIGASADCIDMAEDRERFDALLEGLGIARPKGFTVKTTGEALVAAERVGYPVLMRPSYVLGGQNMIIAFSDADIREYMAIILEHETENTVLIDKYLAGMEIEVDAICDGEEILVPGIMEHVERTGIHSGDSIAMYPAGSIDDDLAADILRTTEDICRGLGAIGLVNIQYIIMDREIYVIEVNPRASRTVPYMSKVTGVPMCELATRVSLGERLCDLGYGTGLHPLSPYVAVKVPVFSFEKLTDVDTQLGPEMKSTGEVLGLGRTSEEALYKGLVAAGYKMGKTGGVFLTVRDSDKAEIADIAKKFHGMGFPLYATAGTAEVLRRAALEPVVVDKIHENGEDNVVTLLESGEISYILSTSAKGRDPRRDSVQIRRKACLLGIPCLTSLDTMNAMADSLMSRYSEGSTELVDICHMRRTKTKLPILKMHGTGNDYIFVSCLERQADSPESLAVFLCRSHYGVGAEGLVLIYPSDTCDAGIRQFNLDGSEGEMGGNAIRCVAKYLYDYGIVRKRQMTIETRSGARTLRLRTVDNKVSEVAVDMGPARLAPAEIPVALDGDRVVGRRAVLAGEEREITCLSVGNPHCVLFVPSTETAPVDTLGPAIETDPLFPQRVNVEFVQVENETTLRMRVWERGTGETMACGTGACAAAVAAVLGGHCPAGRDIRVLLPGGELKVSYTPEGITLTGNAVQVFEGVVEL